MVIVDPLGVTLPPSPGAGRPIGVEVGELQPHPDLRGTLIEWFRGQWFPDFAPRQWNIVSSHAGVLRGVHVHPRHSDRLFLAGGHMLLGLCDIRPTSPSFGARECLELRGDRPRLVGIPPGVAHGFYFSEESTLIYGTDEYFDSKDELGCRWDDPELGLDFPARDPILSDRDHAAGSFASMIDDYVSALEAARVQR